MQPPYNVPWHRGINPYALGFAMWTDIRRICEEPTEEDKRWFPDIAGSNWRETFDFAMRNFKDESFIAQFLSPKVIRDFRMFAITDDDDETRLKVAAIHDDAGYQRIRETLSEQYNIGSKEPNLQVWNVDVRGDRSLTLRHQSFKRRPLHASADEMLKHVARLWGFTVRLETADDDGKVQRTRECRVEGRAPLPTVG
jgi:spore cortex formation protein SpoVR/YcgB (stage V sporulation)